jgi:hypothetical protein
MTIARLKNTMVNWFSNFMLTPASARPLAALRIAISLVLLLQAFLMRSVIFDIFSVHGYVQGELAKSLNNSTLPQISHVMWLLKPFGASETFCILFVSFAYVVSLSFLGLGFNTRTMAFLSWLFHWVLMNTANSTTYGLDLYAHVFLFYFIWVPCGLTWSIDAILKGEKNPFTSSARVGLRILQLHLCITYLASGIEKSQGEQWWNGELMWRALMLPVYRQFDMTWLAHWPLFSTVTGWLTLVAELGYFIFIWPKCTRKIWVLMIVGLHFGIVIFLGLHLFGLIMMTLTACLFGVSAEKNNEALQ